MKTELTPQPHGGALQRGGPGRRALTDEQKAALEGVRKASPELITKMIDLARKGDRRMLELALAYALGKPTEKVEMSGPDGGPIEHADAVLNDHESRALVAAARRYLREARTRQDAPVAEEPAVEPGSPSRAATP